MRIDFLQGLIILGITLVGGGILIFLWSLFRAPYEQRDELRRRLKDR